MRKLSILAFALSCGAQAAAASDADVARQFGLLGEWAVDCSKPAGPDDPHQSFTLAADGTITRMLDMTAAFNGASTLRDLKLLDADKMVSTWVRASDGATTTVTVQNSGNRSHGWESLNAAGTAIIHNGAFVSSGLPTPWFEKCSGP
jgi:hypothetical protein